MANNYYRNNDILPIEKIISILSYITFGMAGFVWLIFGAFMKQSLRPFIKYHIYQSIFLSILFFIVSNFLILIVNMLQIIPVINLLAGAISYFFAVSIINIGFLHLSIVQIGIFVLIVYLSVGVVNNKYSYLPWVSDIIKVNIGR